MKFNRGRHHFRYEKSTTMRQLRRNVGWLMKSKLFHATLVIFFIYQVVTFFSLSYPGWQSVEELDRSRLGVSKTQCKFPELRLDDPAMAPFFKHVPHLHCREQPNVICVVGDEARPCQAGQSHSCAYHFVERYTDYRNVEGGTVRSDSDVAVKLKSDFFHVECKQNDDSPSWTNLMAGISFRPEIWSRTGFDKLPSSASGLNFLMVGIDSVSRLTFQRKLPNTFQYIKDVLGGVILNGYNIVGDGTPQALIPILTGKTEKELPEVRRRKLFRSNYVNIYPFVWNNFSNAGYVTAFAEDVPAIGTFTYRLNGFDQQPTDHYLRTFYLEVDKIMHKHKRLCLGDTPRHKVLLDWIVNFFDYYVKRPKFLFSFSNELSHDDINLIGLADDDTVHFLKTMKSKGYLDNTLLVIMSDHGHRFTEVRETPQGKYEERLPFFAIVAPKMFQKKYPKAWSNLQTNAGRLTTPFDIHETISSLLKFNGGGTGDDRNRGISLFDEVPLLRTCEDAGIEPHWCTCLNWGRVQPDDPIVVKAADALVAYLNNLTVKYRNHCTELKLENVVWVEKYAPSNSLMRFKQSNDADGFQGDFTSEMELKDVYYQIRIHTSPGNGHFEATTQYVLKSDEFIFNQESISRINAYGHDGDCILNVSSTLQKYCYCTSTN